MNFEEIQQNAKISLTQVHILYKISNMYTALSSFFSV
jgi:hypothetical protein